MTPRREIWAACWRSAPTNCRYLTQMIRLEGYFHPGYPAQAKSSLPNPATVAAQSKTLPPGRAAIQWWRYSNSFFYPPAPVATTTPAIPSFPIPWDQSGVAATRAEWQSWLQSYRSSGGRLDYLVGDCERWGIFASWDLSQAQIEHIVAHPMADRPYMGTPPLTKLLDGFNVANAKTYLQTKDYMKWDVAIGTLTAASMKVAVWEPAAQLYPGLRGSNYNGIVTTVKPSPDLNGHTGPWSNMIGTASGPVAYGEMESISTGWFIDPSDPTQLSKSGTKRLERSPWNAFLVDVQRGRACKRSAPAVPLHPWIAIQAWKGDSAETVGYARDLRYHDEMVRHYALLGTEVFMYWNPENEGQRGATWTAAERIQCAERLNGILAEVNVRLDGVVAEVVTTTPFSFEGSVVTSGARRRDGKWIWRTTVRTDVQRLRDLNTGAVVALAPGEVGRWDVTESAVPPRFEPVAGGALVTSTPTRR